MLGAPTIAAALLIAATSRADAPPPPPPGFEPAPTPITPLPPPPPPPPGFAPPPAYGHGAPAAVPPGPPTLPHEEGMAVPAGYHPEARVRRGLVIGGAVTFGVAYFFSVMTTAIADSIAVQIDGEPSPIWPLYIPAVGPFVALGTADAKGFGAFALTLDGVVQTAGLGMLIAGVVAKQTRLVRDTQGSRNVQVAPLRLGKDGWGLGLVGTM